ncbi:hypothetical protein ACWCXE_27220 [Streptomyces sp. NPDC001780]
MSGTRTQPECRIGEHEHCSGPVDVTAGGAVVLRIRCACPCHQAPAAGAAPA